MDILNDDKNGDLQVQRVKGQHAHSTMSNYSSSTSNQDVHNVTASTSLANIGTSAIQRWLNKISGLKLIFYKKTLNIHIHTNIII